MTHYWLELNAGEGPGPGAGRHLGVHLEGVQPRPHRVTHGGEGAVLRLLETDRPNQCQCLCLNDQA